MSAFSERPIDRPVAADYQGPLTSKNSRSSAGNGGVQIGHPSDVPTRGTRLSRRGLVLVQQQLSDRDLAILRSIDEFRCLSTKQLAQLHFAEHASRGAAARATGRVLARLARERILIRLPRRIGGLPGGSSQGCYVLGPVGDRLLGRGDHHGWWEPSPRLVRHRLAIADVFLTVINAARRGELEVISYQTEPACWRALAATRERLKPDGHLVFAKGDYEFHWFIEVDLGTEHRSTLERHCEEYLRLFEDGGEQAESGVFPRVAWLTTDHERAERLRDLARKIQGDVPLFEIGLLDEPLNVLAPERGSP